MANDSFATIVDILKERDISFDPDALSSACNDAETQTTIQAWIDEYLTPETLLTKDEAALYATISETGVAETLAAQDLSGIEGLNNQQVQNAIEELKRSTTAIEKQSEALRLQQNAMSSLLRNSERTLQGRSNADNDQLRKWNAERGHIAKEIRELSSRLAQRTSEMEHQSRATEVLVKKTVDSIFKSDDKLLLSLQKLASHLDSDTPDTEKVIERVRELCARLIKHTVEGIRTRLDHIYLQASKDSSDGGNNSDSQELKDLQEELESLYSEVLPVAQMSAEQKFLEPAVRRFGTSQIHGQERMAKAVKYIHDCLNFLIKRVETSLERTEEIQGHRMALGFVLDCAHRELSQSLGSSECPITSPTKSSTQRRRKSSTSQSPVRLRNTRRRSSGEELEPEHQLARNMGVLLLTETDSEPAQVEALEQMLSDRVVKLGIHANSLQDTTESSISSHLSDAHLTLQTLRDSLFAESPYHKIRFLNPEIEDAVEGFSQDVQYVQNSVEEIDLQQLQAKNIHRDRFVDRWSR